MLLKIMGELRGKIIDRGEGSDENRKHFEALVESDILEQIRRGKWKKVEKIVQDLTGVTIDLRSMEASGFGIQASGIEGKSAGPKEPGGKKQAISKKTKGAKEVRPARP